MNIENIESIRKIIFPAVSNVVSKLEEENYDIKITMLREIFNEAINGALNISHYSNTNIKAMFSGRGRAWAKTKVSEDNPVWVSIRHTLTHEILHNDPSSKIYIGCTNLLDTFESAGIAWMRFSSISKNTLRFQLRHKGSKLEDHIKFYTDSTYLLTGNITNLEGVPHNLNLEEGNFEKQTNKKKINIEVSKEELRSFGIQTIEDII